MAKISCGTLVPCWPQYPGTEADISRGTKCTEAEISRGTLGSTNQKPLKFLGFWLVELECNEAEIGRSTLCIAADIGLGTWVLQPTRYMGTTADFGRQNPLFLWLLSKCIRVIKHSHAIPPWVAKHSYAIPPPYPKIPTTDYPPSGGAFPIQKSPGKALKGPLTWKKNMY